VIESVPGPEDLGVNGPPSHRLEGYRPDELARAASHHHIDFSAGLAKQTRQPH